MTNEKEHEEKEEQEEPEFGSRISPSKKARTQTMTKKTPSTQEQVEEPKFGSWEIVTKSERKEDAHFTSRDISKFSKQKDSENNDS